MAHRSPFESMLDAFVYVPIGLLFEGPALLSKLAEDGRRHVESARALGQDAMQSGQAEFVRQFDDAFPPLAAMLRSLGVFPDPVAVAEAPAPPPPPVHAETPRVPIDSPDAEELAVPDYDSLSASHVVSRLSGLTPDELESVRRYEIAHRARKTIVSKIVQLQK